MVSRVGDVGCLRASRRARMHARTALSAPVLPLCECVRNGAAFAFEKWMVLRPEQCRCSSTTATAVLVLIIGKRYMTDCGQPHSWQETVGVW